MLYFIVMAFLFMQEVKSVDYQEQPLWDDKLDFAQIEAQLNSEPIVKQQKMASYLKEQGKQEYYHHSVYLVTLRNGLKAVFKPERRLENTYGELAAYRADQWLGQRLVPPMVIKEYKGRRGSLHFFIESPFDLLNVADRERAFNLVSLKAKSDMMVFYFIFGQCDINWGNQIIGLDKDGKARLAIIDHAGIIRPKCHGGRSISNGLWHHGSGRFALSDIDILSQATLDRYKRLTLPTLRWFFEGALKKKIDCCTPRFFKAILQRRDAVLAAAQHKTIIQ